MLFFSLSYSFTLRRSHSKRKVAFVSIERILDHKPMSPNLYRSTLSNVVLSHYMHTPLAIQTFIKWNSLSVFSSVPCDRIHTDADCIGPSIAAFRIFFAFHLSFGKKLAIVFWLNQNRVINFHLSVVAVCVSFSLLPFASIAYTNMREPATTERKIQKDECIFWRFLYTRRILQTEIGSMHLRIENGKQQQQRHQQKTIQWNATHKEQGTKIDVWQW